MFTKWMVLICTAPFQSQISRTSLLVASARPSISSNKLSTLPSQTAMACELFPFYSLTPLIIIIFFFFCFSQADTLPSITPIAPIALDKACDSTPHPILCKSVLPEDGESNLYDYARFSMSRSLSAARKFIKLINHYLKRSTKFSQTTVRALEDCRLLSGLTRDFLTAAAATINSTNKLLLVDACDVQTLLSAIVTNQLTCLDGLQSTESASSFKNSLYTPIRNGTRLFSVSLALFTRAWVHKKKKVPAQLPPPPSRKQFPTNVGSWKHGRLPFKMADSHRRIFEIRSGRKLSESSSDGVMVSNVVVVNQDGSGDFMTINDAVAAAPNNTDVSSGYFLIFVVEGVYEEYVSIAKNKMNLMMIGDGINRTVITGNRNVVDGWTTFNSATFAVVGQGFVAINITFRNTAGAIKHQAVAVRNGADLSVFYSCSFVGFQDTLYTHSLRQFYRECDIYGTIDFIFGNAAVVLQNCNIYARLPMAGQTNAITAQGRTDPNQNTGTSIQNCRILATPDLAMSNGTTKTYLGRPWKMYSRAVFMQSFIDGFIDPKGWLPWSGDSANLDTLYYAEYNNTGAGSDTDQRVEWPGYHVINSSDASNFTVSNFILGDTWLPKTGIAYFGGLL